MATLFDATSCLTTVDRFKKERPEKKTTHFSLLFGGTRSVDLHEVSPVIFSISMEKRPTNRSCELDWIVLEFKMFEDVNFSCVTLEMEFLSSVLKCELFLSNS